MSTSMNTFQALDASQRHVRAGAKRIAAADPNETLSVTIRLRRKPGSPSLPAQKRQGDTTHDRVILSRAEFAATYGAAAGDIEQVIAFANANGLSVMETSAARRTLVLKGTVAQMNSAFHVDLGRYQSASETYRGREGLVYLPPQLQGVVVGVFGLDNRRMARRAAAVRPDLWTGTATPLTPQQVAMLYQFPSPLDAAGQTIGLLEFGGGFYQSDVDEYFKNGVAPASVIDVPVNGATNNPGNAQHPNDADVEVALDIDVAGSVAQGATIAVYFSTFDENGWVQAVTTAVLPEPGQPTPSVISISWGWPELETVPGTNPVFSWSPSAIAAVSETFQEAAALGITVLVASGDSGSGCGIGDDLAHVLYPASDSWVTACGGTVITNVNGSSFSEQTWQDGNGNATGGGVSAYFVPPPQWQSTVKLSPSVNDGHLGRNLPDVAGNADPSSGYELVLYGHSVGPVGGTSAVAPLYAGLIADLNARLGAPVGYLNPTLYLNGGAACRDVADGISNATDGAPGYTSTSGYNACTGWGSIIGTKLLAEMSALVPRTNRVAMSANAGGELQAIYLWTDDLAYLVWQDTDGGWHPYGALPNPKNVPFASVALAQGNGNLQAICLGRDDGQPYLIWQNDQGKWNNAGPLPNPDNTPYAAIAVGTGGGNLQVICLGRNDGQAYLIWQDKQTGNWNYYGALPNPNALPYSALATGVGNGNNLQLVCIGKDDGQPYLLWQNSQTGGWNYYGALPNPSRTPYSAVATGRGNGGNLQAICLGQQDGQPYLIWQANNSTGAWSFYGALPNPSATRYSAVTTGVGSGGNLQVIFIGDDGQPYLIWQSQQGGWSNYGALPNPGNMPFFKVAAAVGNGGNLQVICTCKDDPTNAQPPGESDPSAQPYLIWQSSTTGNWSYFGCVTSVSISAANWARQARGGRSIGRAHKSKLPQRRKDGADDARS